MELAQARLNTNQVHAMLKHGFFGPPCWHINVFSFVAFLNIQILFLMMLIEEIVRNNVPVLS
jgi:hypothetical protein